MTQKENRINSFALSFLERQRIVPNLYADQIISSYREGYHQAEKDLGKEANSTDDTSTAYVVTRCEEHSDYVEKVFFDESKAQAYCDKFNNDENEYARNITKIEVTL